LVVFEFHRVKKMGIYTEFKRELNESYLRLGVGLRHPHTLGPLLFAEKGVSAAAPVAAVMSVGADPKASLLEKAVDGPVEVGRGLYKTTKALAENQGIRDFAGETLSTMLELGGNAAENIYSNPLETAGVMAAVYVAGKAVAGLIGLKRKALISKYREEPPFWVY
jgi:hypothetical protein